MAANQCQVSLVDIVIAIVLIVAFLLAVLLEATEAQECIGNCIGTVLCL